MLDWCKLIPNQEKNDKGQMPKSNILDYANCETAVERRFDLGICPLSKRTVIWQD